MIHVVVIIMIHVVVIIMIHVVVVIMIHVVVVIMIHVVIVIMIHVVIIIFFTSKGIQESLIFRRRPVELEPGFDQVLGIDRVGVIEPDAPGIGPPILIPG